MNEIEAALLSPARATLGEGPAWDARTGRLVWVDIPNGTVHLSDAEGRPVGCHRIDGPVGAALPAAAGGWLVATADGLSLLSESGDVEPVNVFLADDRDVRCNDAKCDPSGRAFVGTMSYTAEPARGALFRVEPDRSVTKVRGGLAVANGLGWSPDGATMYHIDTPTRMVLAFDFDPATGALGSGRAVVAVPPEHGLPDGMCVDDDGFLWVAMWRGGAVRRYSPRGLLDRVVRLPVPGVTSCAFGGPRRDRLFITTAAKAGGVEALAGGLFAIDPGVTGPAAVPWVGSGA